MNFQIENLEDLLKEKDNQVDIAKSRLSQVKCWNDIFSILNHKLFEIEINQPLTNGKGFYSWLKQIKFKEFT